VFRGAAANPVVFAIVAGRTQFAAGDRLYYELVRTRRPTRPRCRWTSCSSSWPTPA
jgi:hypothetical protein